MTTLREHAEQYLVMRRKLGFKLTSQGPLLMSFIAFTEHIGIGHVTTDTAVAWATGTRRSKDWLWWSRRLMVVRIFARHMRTLDPDTEIPPEDVLPHRYRRQTPHLYSPAQIDDLLNVAGRLRPALRALTYRSVICLLAVTGMRISEACRLDRDDVDLGEGILTIRDSKFGKSRLVPIHSSTVDGLKHYARQRDRLCPNPAMQGFFVSTRGSRLDCHNVPHTFSALVSAAGIKTTAGQRPPRMHDLRHSYATATLLDWYRAGVDVQAKLPLLSTYLGHADPKSTYWYLSGSPELLGLAAARLEHAFGGRP